jgi:hypothetical protein
MLLFRLFKFKYGHATEIREFWGICHENVPVSQQICKKIQKSLDGNKICCMFVTSMS